jgi:hypothetical protein
MNSFCGEAAYGERSSLSHAPPREAKIFEKNVRRAGEFGATFLIAATSPKRRGRRVVFAYLIPIFKGAVRAWDEVVAADWTAE